MSQVDDPPKIGIFARMTAENLQLAPAAGAGIGKLLFDRLLANPRFLPALEEAVLGGLEATRTYWTKGEGNVTEPDFRTRIQAAAMTLAQAEGEPIKRVIHQHLSAAGALDIGGALRDSPALQEALQRELEKAQWRTSGHQEHKRPGGKRSKPAEPAKMIEVE